MLTIEDLSFEVADATVQATLADGQLLWDVQVEANEKEVDEENWRPKAYLDLFPAPSRSARELLETGWNIPSARELGGGTILPGQANCCLYVFEHHFLEQSQLRFSMRSGELFLSWSGRCSVHWDERYGSDLQFLAETPVDFLGFVVPASTEPEARLLMQTAFDLSGMTYHREPGRQESFFLPKPGAWPIA